MNHRNTTLTGLTFCLLMVFILSSCNDSIESISKKATYSIYGVIGLKAKTNYLRIKNLSVPLILDSKNSLNATVRLKDLETGHSQLLTEDSLVHFRGVAIHNLVTTMDIRPLTTYEVIIKRNSDGHKITERVTTPLPTTIKITPRVATCKTIRTITYENVIAGETIVAYAVAVNKIPPPPLPHVPPIPYNPPPKYNVLKFFHHFKLGAGKFGSKPLGKYKLKLRFPCQLKSPQIQFYSAIYGPGYDKNKHVSPDSVRNIDRFIKSKLLAIVKDTVSFVALLPPDTSSSSK